MGEMDGRTTSVNSSAPLSRRASANPLLVQLDHSEHVATIVVDIRIRHRACAHVVNRDSLLDRKTGRAENNSEPKFPVFSRAQVRAEAVGPYRLAMDQYGASPTRNRKGERVRSSEMEWAP